MDGQSFDPKFGTEIQPSKVVKPITDRNEFVQKIIQNRTEVKPQSWFKVENLYDDGEDIAEQTGASEFAAGIIRNDYDPLAIKKLEQDEISLGADETLVTQPYYNPTQDNRWLYGENLGITRYEALRRAVGLQEGQSFTEFYNVNKFVPQGFELDAKLLLREEKIKALETKMLNGEIGYDTFLYRAYGKDILKAQGHDFSSSLYWYTRRKQGYFDSIKNNLAFMNDVLRSAEQSYISESWNRTASSLKLSDLDAAVASEKPLSTVQMKELFPNLFEALSETIDSDRKIHDLFLSGQLGRQFQPFIDTNGDGKIDYYLHMNGRLYSAAEESEAQGHQARVKYDEEGKVASVFLPGTFEWDAGSIDSALASFSKVFWGVPEFIGYIFAATADLGDFVLGTGLGLWDGQDLGEATNLSAWYTTSNKLQNSWGITSEDFWIADQSLMKNGDIDVENAARGVASAAGTVLGMMSLAWVGGILGKAGAGASNLLKGTNLSIDKAGAFALKGSQIKGFIPKVLYTTGSISSRMSMIKNGAPIFAKGLWGMSAEAAGYLAFRDFFNTVGELSARQELTPGLSNEDVLARSFEMTVVNALITFTFRSVADQGIVDRFATTFKKARGKILSSVGAKQVTKGIEKAWSGYFTKFTKPSAIINTIGDAVENWATMAMNMGVSMNQEDYTFGESVANLTAGSAALLNNPSALAMQIFQGFQTYFGSAFAFREGYGQETRNVAQAMGMVKGTHEEVDITLRNAAANATGTTRASILAIQKGYDEHRLYEHTYEFDAQGRIIKSEVVLNDKGEKVFTKDPESSQVAALLWLHNTMKDAATLAIDPKKQTEPDSIVSRALKKAIEKQKIEEMVIKHQLIFGVYNQHMERRRDHYEKLLKKPNRARELFDKSFNVYKKIEVALGRSDSEQGQAARAALLLEMSRRSDLETRRALALKEEKLLSENPGFQEAWGDVSERLVVETLSGKIDFSQLTVENLRAIAEKRANAKGETIDLKGDRGYLVRYILTNLSVKDFEALQEYMIKNPTSSGFASGIKLTVKGAGGLDEKKRQDVLKLLDLIATWETTLEAETGQKANFVKLSDGTYIIQASLENEFANLNLYDYIGTTLRLATALKLEAVSGTKANFKTEALELMIDKLDQQASGTFKKNLASTDPKEKLEAQARVNKLLDNLVQKGILTYEQAARIYQDSYASPDALADTNSVAYFRNTLNKFNAALAEYNSNPENPTTKFAELQTEFGELMENASQPLKDAIFKQLNLTQKDLDDFKQKQYEALKNAKKTLGSLVGLRLPASLDLDVLASSTGSSRENLSNLAEKVFGYLQLLRTRRVAGFQFNDDLYNKVLDLYLRTVDNYFVNRPDDGFNTLNLGEQKLKDLRDVLTLGFDKKGTASGLNVFDTPILMDLKLSNYLIAKGFTNEEINGVQRIIQTMQVNFIKDSLLVYNDQFLKNSNPELYRSKTENLSPEEIRELFYAEYIDEEYSRATKGTSNEGSIKDNDPERTKKREEFLLKNDPFFLRNLGDASPIQADEINGLEAQVKNYFAFIYQDTYDQRASGKIYISLNTFLPPMIAKAYRSLQYKDKDIPAIIEALDGPKQDLFAAFGFTSDDRTKLQNEINQLKNYLLKYPDGVLVFDITGKTGMDGLVEFLKDFGINFNQQKGKLREFGIQGRVPGETGSTSFKAIELVFGSTKQNELVGFKDEEYEEELEVSGSKVKIKRTRRVPIYEEREVGRPFTVDDVIANLRAKEKEAFAQMRTPADLFASYEARLNNAFSNIIHIDENTIISPNSLEEILLSAGVEITDAMQSKLVETFGALSEAEKVKFGKVGGLAEAIQVAFKQMGAAVPKDAELSNFKLLITLAKYIVDWKSSTTRKPIIYKVDPQQPNLIQDFKDTGIWKVQDLGDGKFQLEIEDIKNEADAFARLAKWINSKKGQAIDLNLLVPNTARFGGASVVTSPLDNEGKPVAGQEQSAGTGDYPFAVLKRNLQSGVDIMSILDNKITFNLTKYELNEDSYTSLLTAISGKTIAALKKEFANTKNPFIRMAINTLSNGTVLSKFYAQEVKKAIRVVSEDNLEMSDDVIVTLMNPTARRVIAEVLSKNPDATVQELTGLVNTALRRTSNLNLTRNTSVSALEQLRLEGNLDYVNQSMLGTYRPQISKIPNIELSENDVRFVKDQLDKVYTVSDEENFTVYNKYSNVINALLASNDMDQQLTAEQRKSRYGSANGGAIRFDVEALYYMSDEELEVLQDVIESLNFTAGSKRIVGEKLNYLRLSRASKAKAPGDVRFVGAVGAATVTTAPGVLAVKAKDGGVEDQRSIASQFIKNLQTKATPSNVRDERVRLNNVLNNSKFSQIEQDWALYLDSELRKLNQGSTTGNRIILNLSKNDNLARYVVGIASTAAVIEKQLLNPSNKFQGTQEEAKQMAIELATKMQILTDGSDFVSMATKYLFVDLKTGKIINTASLIDGPNNQQHLNDFSRAFIESIEDKDLSIGIIELNKNMMTGAGALSKEKFGYYIVNENNLSDIKNIVLDNIFYQASLEDDLKNASDREKIIGVLNRTVTQKDFETELVKTFALLKQELNLKTDFFDEVGRVLVGTLSDTIYNSDGTYTTEEMYEARELGYEFGLSNEDFQLLVSSRNKKIADVITYFINKDSLPLPIATIMDVVKRASVQATESAVFQNRLRILEDIKAGRKNISNLKDEVREARNKARKAKRSRIAIFEEARKNLTGFYNGFDKEEIDLLKTLDLQNESDRKIFDAYQERFVEPRKSLDIYLKVFQRDKDGLKEFFEYIKNPFYNPFKARDILINSLEKYRVIDDTNKASGMEESERVKTKEHDIKKAIISVDDLFRRVYEMDEYFRGELDKLELEKRNLKLIKGEEKYIAKKQRFIDFQKEKIRKQKEYIDTVLQRQRYVNAFDANNNDLIDDYISGRKTSEQISNLIKAEADDIGKNEGEEARSQFLKDFFEDVATRYLLESDNGEALNYRLLKINNINNKNDSSLLKFILQRNKQNNLKDDYLERFLEQEPGNTEQDFDTVFFDIEAFFSNSYSLNKTGKLTSPFSATFLFLKRVGLDTLTKVTKEIQERNLDWNEFKTLLKNELVRVSKTVYIPVYYFDSLSGKYKIVNSSDLVRQNFPEYFSKYVAEDTGASREVANYLNDIQTKLSTKEIKAELTVKEHEEFKTNYVGRAIESEIGNRKVNFVGYNNKKYDESKLLDSEGDVGYQLITNKKLFDKSFDTYNDLISGLSTRFAGDRRSLDEFRRIERIDAAGAHESEDDVLFTLFLTLKEMNRLEDSNLIQTSIIPRLKNLKRTLGIKGRLTNADVDSIEEKINERLELANINKDFLSTALTERENNFFGDYGKLFDQSNEFRAKLIAELISKREALFKQSQFKKGWKIYSGFYENIDPKTKEFANKITNEKTKLNIGNAISFVVNKLYNLFNEENLGVSFQDKLNYRIPNSNYSIFDFVALKFRTLSQNDVSTKSNLDKFREALLTGSENPEQLITALAKIINADDLTKNSFDLNNINNEFASYKSNEIGSNVTNLFSDSMSEENVTSFKHEAEREKATSLFFKALEPIVDNFLSDVSDPVTRNNLLKDLTALIAYDFDQKEIKNRLEKFGFNDVLTNVNRAKAFEVLNSLAASSVSFDALYKTAQALSAGEKIQYFQKNQDGKYQLVNGNVDNESYYISESNFKSMFGYSQKVDLALVVEAVRKEYSLTGDQELYVSILRQPSDKQNTLHSYKVKIIPDGKGIQSTISADALKSNHSGDFDGDKLFIFKPTASQLWVANKLSKYQHGALNAFGKVLTNVLEDQNVIIPNNKKLIKEGIVFKLSSQLFADVLRKDYATLIAIKDVEKQKLKYEVLLKQRVAQLKAADNGVSTLDEETITDIVKKTWLTGHDVSGSIFDSNFIYTTQNQAIDISRDQRYFALKENAFKLSSYIYKSKLGNIDSVTGLYRYPTENQKVISEGKNSGYGRLFQTTGIHLTKDSLTFIKANPQLFISSMKNYILNDALLNDVNVDTLFDPTMKQSVNGKDFLIKALDNLEENITRDDFDVMFQSFLDIYDTLLRSSKDYNNTLFLASTTKDFTKSKEFLRIEAKERRQMDALYDLAFSIGIAKDFKDVDGKLIENLPDLLTRFNDTRILDNSVRFQNESSDLAARFLLNITINQDKNDSIILKSKIGKTEFNNAQKTRIIYTASSKIGGVNLNEDSIYALPSAKKFQVVNMQAEFFDDETPSDGLRLLSGYEKQKIVTIKEPGGLKLKNGVVIPENSKIIIFGDSYDNPSLKNNVYRDLDEPNVGKEFVLFAFVDDLYSPTDSGFYKVTIPGTNKNKNTLNIFDIKASGLDRTLLEGKLKGDFVKGFDKNVFDKASASQPGKFEFYDKEGNLVESPLDNWERVEYVVEENNLSLIENTKNWKSNDITERFFDDPSIINNAGNPEAIMYFGRLGKMFKLNFNENGTITAEIDNKELYDIQNNLKRLAVHDVDTNNGIRTLRILQAKTMIFNSKRLTEEQKNQELNKFLNYSNLNTPEGSNLISSLFNRLYNTTEEVARWENLVKKNKMYNFIFSPQLNDSLFAKTPTQMSTLNKRLISPTKAKPIQVNWIKGNVELRGDFATLQGDVVTKEGYQQTGSRFFVDGLSYMSHQDLLNLLLKASGSGQQISNSTINKLAPVIGARNKVGSTYGTRYLPALKSDVVKGDPNDPYDGQASVKTGETVNANRTQIGVYNEGPNLITKPKENETNMYQSDLYSIDENFLSKMLNYFGYDATNKKNKINVGEMYNDSYYTKLFKSYLATSLANAKNVDEKVAQLATDYSRYALTFDLEKITTDEKTKEVKVTLKRSQRTGKMSDFKQTLKEELGSVYYFDLQDKKKQDLENSTAIANLIKNTNLDGVDLLDAIEKSKATPDYFDNFKAWLQRREVYIQNKAEAQKKFREEYASIFDSDDQLTERYLQNNLEKSIVELETGEKETERAIHTVSLDRSKKQSMLVGKNMDEEDVIKLDPLKLTTSGVSEEDPRSFEVSQIVTLLKKEPSQVRGYLMSKINTIKDLVFKYGIEKEVNLYMYRIGMAHKWSTLQSKLDKETKADKRIVLEDQIREIKLQFKEVNSPQELMNLGKDFEEVYGDIAGDLQDAVMNIYNYQNYVVRDSNEPLQDIYWIMLPTIKTGTNKSTFESIKQLVLNPEERLLNKNGHVPYEGYNFFRSIESTVYSLTKHIAAENFSVRAQKAKVLVNLPVVNFLQEKIKEFMNLDSTKEAIKEYDEEGKKQYEYKVFSVFQETISNTLSEDSDIIILEKNYRTLNPAELYVLLYNNIEDKLAQIGLTESEAGSTMKREQFGTLNYNKAKDALNLHAFRNDILARLTNMVGKDTLTDYLYNELQNFATSKGYALADRYGRKRTGKIEDIRPLSEVSMEWVSTAINDNVGYLGGFKKNLLTSALSGDVYLIDAKLQDHLHKYFYTTKAPSKFAKITRKLQSLATALIMSNPFKIVDRVLKYSLTDLTFMTIANPKTMFKVPQSRKDLSAFFQSKSGVISKDLAAFFATQGIDPAKTTFDTVLNDFEGVQKKGNMLDNYFEFMGQPFEFQTLLVRYAYWLQTVEDLNNGKENVYGSAYYNKDNVQKIQDTYYETTDVDPDTGLPRIKNTANENKAAYLMAQQLGAPGDFPLLAKDLNGIFMFTTFPLALVRWAKGEAFSMATAVKNLFVEGEQKQALNWLATQGGGLLGSALLVQALISLIAGLYNVDEETEKEWQEKQALPDVLATILNGSPVFDIYNTADPVKLFSELTYAPFVEAAQENKQDAIYGRPDDGNIARGNGLMKWVFQNILGKVNPVFKDPVEVVLGISTLGDSVYLQDGPGYENFVRKMSAYIFGGSGSRALANYIQEVYNDAPRSPDLVKLVAGGMTRVIQAELGNSKAYKGDVKNYYKVLSKIKSFNYMNQRVTSYSPNTSTSFNQESYGSLKDELRSLFNKKEDFSKIYASIMNHLENGGSLQEVRSALNNITLIGQLDKIDDLGKLTEVLSDKEVYELEKAIIYEQTVFPWLNDFRENVRQSIESTYSRGSRYTPRYYQPYRRMYGDSRNVYYRPNYSRYTQNPFNAYRSAWYTINQIGSNKK